MSNIRYSVPIVLLLGIGIWMFSIQSNAVQAQPRITNTPIPVVIPTTAPTNPPQQQNNAVVEASPSPTFTPTQPLPDVRLISVAASGTALIRDFPEDGTVLGVLADNTEYQVLGQYFSWYQIQYPSGPNGRAWVYYEDIRLSGNIQEIQLIDPNVQPAQFSEQDLATQTAVVLFQTPGFAETATAASRVLEIDENDNPQDGPTSEFPATYTPPAEIVALRATAVPNVQITPTLQADILDSTIRSVSAGNIPPLLPIVGLLVFGALGMLIAALRR